MDDMLYMRLDLLEGAGEIDSSIKESVVNFVKTIEDKYFIKVTEENGSMLVTHLAMALSRIKKGKKIESINEELFEEVRKTKTYNELPEYYKKIEDELNIIIPKEEKNYIALHVCTLIDKEKNGR
ncbi:PRD domain-containing protein [Sporanaerobacter acetigenes]|uniref:PRD domain-containing protein n=1 Tax=Sporanaerobacter acetigenes TaxID=165813 RepID=UPI00332CD1B0